MSAAIASRMMKVTGVSPLQRLKHEREASPDPARLRVVPSAKSLDPPMLRVGENGIRNECQPGHLYPAIPLGLPGLASEISRRPVCAWLHDRIISRAIKPRREAANRFSFAVSSRPSFIADTWMISRWKDCTADAVFMLSLESPIGLTIS